VTLSDSASSSKVTTQVFGGAPPVVISFLCCIIWLHKITEKNSALLQDISADVIGNCMCSNTFHALYRHFMMCECMATTCRGPLHVSMCAMQRLMLTIFACDILSREKRPKRHGRAVRSALWNIMLWQHGSTAAACAVYIHLLQTLHILHGSCSLRCLMISLKECNLNLDQSMMQRQWQVMLWQHGGTAAACALYIHLLQLSKHHLRHIAFVTWYVVCTQR